MKKNKVILADLTIADYHEALGHGAITTQDLVSFYLKRITDYDDHLSAVIQVNPHVMDQARACDDYYKTSGFMGPLHGVPILVKDNIETQGLATTAGSLSLKHYIPDQDAFLINALKKAGALVLAKSNLHEFAIWGETISSIKGQTVNPYDFSRTPGGSSGGTGAGIAADFAMVGLGTDTVNSVRSPASANALVGIRPTMGLVSRGGIVPYSYTQDTAGPLAKNVTDAVLTLQAMRGFDPSDKATAWAWTSFSHDLKKHLKPQGLQGKRVGLLMDLLGQEKVHEEVNRAFKNTVATISSLGGTCIEVTEKIDTHALVHEVSVHLHEFKDHLNAYLSPLEGPQVVHSMQELFESGLFHPGIKDNLQKALALSTETDHYRMRLLKRKHLQDHLMFIMASQDLDALVYPHQKQLVCKIGDSQEERNGVMASVTGFPSICLPMGFSTPTHEAPQGVPMGFEIMGRPFNEGTLIEIAFALEHARPIRKPPVLDQAKKG